MRFDGVERRFEVLDLGAGACCEVAVAGAITVGRAGQRLAPMAELADALSGAKKIVVCTIQTFPHALEAVRKLAATNEFEVLHLADTTIRVERGKPALGQTVILRRRAIAAALN